MIEQKNLFIKLVNWTSLLKMKVFEHKRIHICFEKEYKLFIFLFINYQKSTTNNKHNNNLVC